MTEQTQAPAADGQAKAPKAEGQAVVKTWFDGAAPEVVGYIQNKGWAENPVKAIEAYQNLEKFHGVPADKIIKLPKDGEPMDSVYDRLGRPASPDKYEIKLPEGVEVDAGRMKAITEAAHKVGLNSQQLQTIAEIDAKFMNEAVSAHRAEIAQKQEIEYQSLQKEWGANASEREELARRFIRNNIPAGVDKGDILSKIEEAVGTATMLKLFANAGDKFREDKITDSGNDRPFGYTKEQAIADKQTLMNELQADRGRLANYNNGIGPDFEKMKRLNTMIAS